MFSNVRLQSNSKIWIISDGRPLDYNLESIGEENASGPVKEYRISDLAWYLLNPDPIIIHDKLVGCNITFNKPGIRRFGTRLKRFLLGSKPSKDTGYTREYISGSHVKMYTFRDADLEAHFRMIYDSLRPYDTLLRMLTRLDPRHIQEITGVCEDIAGNKYRLDLQGTVNDKLNYMINNLLTHVKITMKRAYLSKGLFELRGFDFKSYSPERSYRMIRFFKNNTPSYYVLGTDGKPGFIVPDPKLVYCVQLFEHSLRTNSKLRESVDLCIHGEAKPFKLFFTKQLEFSYSQNHLPKIFRNDYSITQLDPDEKQTIAQSLNSKQRVISFNYVPHSNSGEEKMHTNISVMHDVRALEPLRNQFPELFTTISETAQASDIGKYYLLDSMKGCQDE